MISECVYTYTVFIICDILFHFYDLNNICIWTIVIHEWVNSNKKMKKIILTISFVIDQNNLTVCYFYFFYP